jgi:SAM-dependent methyltransferase
MPLREGTADVVFTKSVLIHTSLAAAAGEIHRVLRAGGRGLFIEPLDRNPIIRLYRRFLAPRAWRAMTRYFDFRSLAELRRPFGFLAWKPFYLVSAGSFFWQYGWKNLSRFQRSLRFWRRADRRLLRLWPALDWWCWFAAIDVRKRP